MTEKKCVFITRPAEDAGNLSRTFEQRGYETFCEPMLSLRTAPASTMLLEQINVRKTQALIITSRHAMAALQAYSFLHDLQLFAIGDADTYSAMKRNFGRMVVVRDVQALFRSIMTDCSPEGGPLIYIRGSFVTHDLSRMFKRQGFTVEEIVAYDMRALEKFSTRLTTRLEKGELHIATFLSARTAEVFVGLAEAAGFEGKLAAMKAAVFSGNIAKACKPEKWKAIGICEQPNIPSLLAEVDKLAAAD